LDREIYQQALNVAKSLLLYFKKDKVSSFYRLFDIEVDVRAPLVIWFAAKREKRPEIYITHVFCSASISGAKLTFEQQSGKLQWSTVHGIARTICLRRFDKVGVQKLVMQEVLNQMLVDEPASMAHDILWPMGDCTIKPVKMKRDPDIDMLPGDPTAPEKKRNKDRRRGGVKYIMPFDSLHDSGEDEEQMNSANQVLPATYLQYSNLRR
jgi:hypothetical protein